MLVALFAMACSAIPVIRFVDEGGVVEGGGGSDGGQDGAAMMESGADAPLSETGADAGGCPGMVPAGAVTCCGSIPCGNAFCSMNACIDCQAKCTVGALCCPNQGGKATCLLQTSTCP